jgi:hypothetical protein
MAEFLDFSDLPHGLGGAHCQRLRRVRGNHLSMPPWLFLPKAHGIWLNSAIIGKAAEKVNNALTVFKRKFTNFPNQNSPEPAFG